MNVGPTAQLGGVIAHLHDPHSIAVLIAKESQSSVANGVFITRLLDRDTRILTNMPIDMSFNGRKFFLRNRAGVTEVEAKSVWCHQRACLANVFAQLSAQHSVKYVGRRMIEHCFSTEAGIDGKMNRIADPNTPFSHSASMHRELRRRVLGVGDLDNVTAGRSYGSPISYLAAGFTIKRRLGCQKVDLHTFNDLRFTFTSRMQSKHLRFSIKMIIANEHDSATCR